jgi:flagellar protein FlaH
MAEAARAERTKRIISTGNAELDKKIGGGMPEGSLSLIEGQSDAGKSVLVQQLIWGGLQGGLRATLYTSENTTRSLLSQMSSLSLDVTDFFLMGRMNIYPVPPALTEDQAESAFQTLLRHIAQLRGFDIVVVDSLTNFVSHVPEHETLTFFTACKDFCDEGRTLLFTMHSYAFSEQMFIRIRSICDAHLRLRIEEVGDQLVKVLEVAKVRGAEKSTGNIITFNVEPNLGMRIVPITKAKA